MASAPAPQPQVPLFDMRITLGSILAFIGMVGSVFIAWGAIGSDIAILKTQNAQISVEQAALKVTVDIVNGKLTDLAFKQGQQDQELKDERRLRNK